MSLPSTREQAFAPLNRGYNQVFQFGRLTLGLVLPLESCMNSPVPSLERHLERARLADEAGFAALWLRDVPFNVPSFGDAGQLLDPFVYLGLLAGQTERIALGVASLVLPLRHPAHVAKAAASVDLLSAGRLLLGVASGDRPEEYPAMNLNHADRGERFRDSLVYIRQMAQSTPAFSNGYGHLDGSLDLLPKPVAGAIPLLITGGSRQDPQWVAAQGDGWITYPRALAQQTQVLAAWRERVRGLGLAPKPVTQSLYVDLLDDPQAPAEPIHLGFRSGMEPLRNHLRGLEAIGVNHVALNLRFNRADTETTLNRLADELLPDFS